LNFLSSTLIALLGISSVNAQTITSEKGVSQTIIDNAHERLERVLEWYDQKGIIIPRKQIRIHIRITYATSELDLCDSTITIPEELFKEAKGENAKSYNIRRDANIAHELIHLCQLLSTEYAGVKAALQVLCQRKGLDHKIPVKMYLEERGIDYERAENEREALELDANKMMLLYVTGQCQVLQPRVMPRLRSPGLYLG